jgi:putative hydrolase of the HAD superfamily
MNFKEIEIIGFDGDDTLWANEPFYQDIEKKLCQLLKDYLPAKEVSAELFKTEMSNLELYGFGAKAFMLSLIETAIRVSQKRVPASIIDQIIDLGKQLLSHPVQLLDGVAEVLTELKQRYKLIVATKGDLLDQQRKLTKSGLIHHFHHIEIMSDKQSENYMELFRNVSVEPQKFLMVGNSMKSDIQPILQLGGNAVYVPFHTTWQHEKTDEEPQACNNYLKVNSISEILHFL